MEKLLPTVDPKRILGVKVPILRTMAKSLTSDYLDQLPHYYVEEDLLHAFILNEVPLASIFNRIDDFLPYLDNWQVVDSLNPACFYCTTSYMDYFLRLTRDQRPYVARLGIVLALHHVQEDSLKAINLLKEIHSDHYYVQMALGWFFAEAVLYCEEEVLALLKEGALDLPVHRKAVRKMKESRRVSERVKEAISAYKK